MQVIMCLCRAHVQLRLTKPILVCLISWWLSQSGKAAHGGVWGGGEDRTVQQGVRRRVGVGREGGGESKSVSLLAAVSCQVRFVLFSIAGWYRLQQFWEAENPFWKSSVCRTLTQFYGPLFWSGGNCGEKLQVRNYFFSIYTALLLHPSLAYISTTVLNPLK